MTMSKSRFPVCCVLACSRMQYFRLRDEIDEIRANERRYRAEALESRRFSCDVCNVACPDQNHLNTHFLTQKHIDNVNGVVPTTKSGLWKLANKASERYYDDVCDGQGQGGWRPRHHGPGGHHCLTLRTRSTRLDRALKLEYGTCRMRCLPSRTPPSTAW